MRYVVRKINDNKYALEEIIYEDGEGNLYTETLAHSKDREHLKAIAIDMNGNIRPKFLYA